jgi:hypothetical protein
MTNDLDNARSTGRQSDKVEGFDPAASPMPTDAEAGGNSSLVDTEVHHHDRPLRSVNESSHGTAMRPFDTAEVKRPTEGIFLYVAIIAVLACLVGLGVFLAVG